jgi:hypothetical protein
MGRQVSCRTRLEYFLPPIVPQASLPGSNGEHLKADNPKPSPAVTRARQIAHLRM